MAANDAGFLGGGGVDQNTLIITDAWLLTESPGSLLEGFLVSAGVCFFVDAFWEAPSGICKSRMSTSDLKSRPQLGEGLERPEVRNILKIFVVVLLETPLEKGASSHAWLQQARPIGVLMMVHVAKAWHHERRSVPEAQGAGGIRNTLDPYADASNKQLFPQITGWFWQLGSQLRAS